MSLLLYSSLKFFPKILFILYLIKTVTVFTCYHFILLVFESLYYLLFLYNPRAPFYSTVRPLSGNADNAFFHISLPSLHDYDDVRVPNFTLLGRRDQRKKRTFFFLSSTSKRLISAPEKFAHISRIEGYEMK